ncbi:MAG: twin-arginine translocase subunit TatC [Bacteroidales bacterium]|nr:twin-arginine translocase subunit TatC [Bacteroidales bacterium]
MTFWEHLEELRWHIVRSVAAVLILAIAAFISKDFIFNQIILAPKSGDFITNRLFCLFGKYLSENLPAFSSTSFCIDDFDLKIININLSGQFLMHFYISIFAGVIVAIPYIIYEIWSFIKPALYEKEQRYTSGAVVWSSLLFLLGVLFSYYLIVPLTILFLGSYSVSDSVENQIALTSYISTVVTLSFAVGVVFELPIFVYFLTKVGIISPAFMRKSRKAMIVIILIVSAIITPADVFSQIIVAIPLFGLYEISILVSDRVFKKREKSLSA